MKDTEKKLIQAVKVGNFDECERLLHQGVNVNARDDDHEIGWSPLLLASRSGNVDLVRLLLHAGADVNAKSKSEQTPLHGASWKGHANVAKLLLDHGANPNAANKFGQTALHWSAHYGHASVVQILISHGALVKARNEAGETPLDKAQSSVVKSAGRQAVIQLLQQSQSTLNFLAILFAKRDEFNFHEWHERMIGVMEDMHDMRIYYTVLRLSLARKMILKRQAEALLERALEKSSSLSSTSEEAFSMWRLLLAKCLHDELIDEHVYTTFDSYDRSSRFIGGIDVPLPSLRSVIHKRTTMINGLEGSTRAVTRTMQVLVRKVQALRNDELASASASTSSAAAHVNPSVQKSKRFRVKLDVLVSMMGSIVNAFRFNTCSPIHERLFARMVDFGDVDHMRRAIYEECNGGSTVGSGSQGGGNHDDRNNNTPMDADTMQQYAMAFEQGVALAAECHKSDGMSGSLVTQVDQAIKRKDPLLVIGFVAGLANPPNFLIVDSAAATSGTHTSQATSTGMQERDDRLAPGVTTIVSGGPGGRPQHPPEKPYYAGKINKPGLPTKSPTASITSTPSISKNNGGLFSKDPPRATKPAPPTGKQLGDPPTKPAMEMHLPTSIPSVASRHLPPIQSLDMPPSIAASTKSLTLSDGGSSREMYLSEDSVSEAFGSGGLFKIYKDAVVSEEDELHYDLHAAIKYCDQEQVQDHLREAEVVSAIINVKDSKGRTPCDLAALTGQLDMLNWLREQGGDFSYKSDARMRALARKRADFVDAYRQLVEQELD